ncbi:MAG: ABC transporter ATP-binding protein [Bacteroidota bacterium]
MRKLFGVLKFIKGYWRYAALNIFFNFLTVLFSLFSLVMLIPLLELLFRQTDEFYRNILAQGEPAPGLSQESLMNMLNYHLSREIMEGGKIRVLVFICVFMVVMVFMKNLTRYMAMYFIAPVRNGVARDLRNRLFGKALVLPLSYYSDERKGDIMARMTSDVKEVEWSTMQSLEMIFRDPLNILVFLCFLTWLSPQLTLFIFILLPVAGLLIARLGKTLRKTTLREKTLMGALLSQMEEMLSGLKIIKGFNAEKNIGGKFRQTNDEYTSYMIRTYRLGDLSSPLSEFIGVAILAVITYFGGVLVLNHDSALSASVFLTYIAIFSQLIPPAKAITTAYFNVQKGDASLERIRKITEAEESIRDPEHPKIIASFDRAIEYRNVAFAYNRGDAGHVLKHINLRIEKGKTIALVGQSGSGKTTLADMLPRFYDPTAGEVLIDGTNIREVSLHQLRCLMGIVTQESILFNDTVFNNIAFGMSGVKEADVIAAAKVANAHEFISQMPQGYQTNIGDRGSKMSGGQRQRISIARAVLKNPPILILDEATSALDTESERLVQDALNKLMKNRTSVVIAHRLSTIQHADEIIVMQRGEIIERGTHANLLAANGTYRKLYDMQAFV